MLSRSDKAQMRWREALGTLRATAVLGIWIALGAVTARAVSSGTSNNAFVAQTIVVVIAVIFAIGGLVIFWVIAEETEFLRLGYRIRQLNSKNIFRWSWTVGSKQQCVYEERVAAGRIQSLPFVRVVLGDGYPAPCEVSLPKEEDWDAQMPLWARGRRSEVIEHMNNCFGGERSVTRFIDAQ